MLEDFTNGQIKDQKNLILYCDGACEPKNPGGVATAGWAFFLLPDPEPEDTPLAQEAEVVRDGRGTNDPKATNNFAEYCALGRALKFLVDQGWEGGSIRVFTDSKLLTNQISTKWKCNKQHLQELRARIWELLRELGLKNVNREVLDGLDDEGLTTEHPQLGDFYIKWIPRDDNEFADTLSKKAYNEYVGSHPPPPRKKKPPKKKFKPGDQLFHCQACGHKGKVWELHIEDGNLNCPMCQTSRLEFG